MWLRTERRNRSCSPFPFASFLPTSCIIWSSQQIEGDLSVGKVSPLVRLGTEKGSKVVQTAVVSLYTTIALLTALKALPLTCLVSGTFSFIFQSMLKWYLTFRTGRLYNRTFLKFICPQCSGLNIYCMRTCESRTPFLREGIVTREGYFANHSFMYGLYGCNV